MKKIFLFVGLIIIMLGIGIWTFKENTNNNKNNQNYKAQRSSTDPNSINKTNSVSNTQSITESIEKEIANFSTKIHNKEEARQNNIRITCNSLTNTEIKPGETF